jgi:hypothetical protein
MNTLSGSSRNDAYFVYAKSLAGFIAEGSPHESGVDVDGSEYRKLTKTCRHRLSVELRLEMLKFSFEDIFRRLLTCDATCHKITTFVLMNYIINITGYWEYVSISDDF